MHSGNMHSSLCHAISAFSFIIEHTIEDDPVYDVASMAAEDVVVELTVHAAGNIVELLMQTLIVLQTTQFLD